VSAAETLHYSRGYAVKFVETYLFMMTDCIDLYSSNNMYQSYIQELFTLLQFSVTIPITDVTSVLQLLLRLAVYKVICVSC